MRELVVLFEFTFLEFLGNFGTHYVSVGAFGGLAGIQTIIDYSYYSKYTDAEVEADVCMLLTTNDFQLSQDLEIFRSHCKFFLQTTSETGIFCDLEKIF